MRIARKVWTRDWLDSRDAQMGNSMAKPTRALASPDSQVEMNLTQFRLISPLGKGTFCKVMAAEEVASGQVVAIKYSSKEKLHEKKAINHIILERNLLEEISHPFIANMLYSFQDTHYVYTVLELKSGGDLRSFMAGPIPEV